MSVGPHTMSAQLIFTSYPAFKLVGWYPVGGLDAQFPFSISLGTAACDEHFPARNDWDGGIAQRFEDWRILADHDTRR